MDTPPGGTSRSRTIAVTSGKGGVGKSNIALNLAMALAETDASVCLLDANLGLGNIDLLCGLNGYWNLSHVITGARLLSEIMLVGPSGVHVIPGASGLADIADCPRVAQQSLLRQMQELEQSHRYLIIDTGTGIHRSIRQFAAAADLVLVVTTPELTSIADAYALVKVLSNNNGSLLQILVNQSESPEQARRIIDRLQHTSRCFLRVDVGSAGHIPRDASVARAVSRRRPFILDSPHSPSSRAVQQLARRLMNQTGASRSCGTFFSRLWERIEKRAA